MLKQMWDWGLAHSKNSVTHLQANVIIFISGVTEGVLDLGTYLDPELTNQIVNVVGADNAHLASRVSLGLMILTKCSRDRHPIPFTNTPPHQDTGGSP